MAQNSNKAITEIRYEVDAFYKSCIELTESIEVYTHSFLLQSARSKLSYVQGYITALNDVGMISDKEHYDFMEVVRIMFNETISTFIS